MDERKKILKVRWQMDERLKILKVSWNGWKVRNTEGQVARMEDRLHLRLGGRDER